MKPFFVILILTVATTSCRHSLTAPQMVSSPGHNAESVYLTHDQLGQPVLAWTERESDTTIIFKYAISANDGESFEIKKHVQLNGPVATHGEGMPKIAFKKDGTVVIAYEKKYPTNGNKYAGKVCFIVSTNEGNTWSKETSIHSDTTSGLSRSYFDIESLADGEVGASWLDIKLDKQSGGRSIRFAKTNSENIFTNELLIDSSACQCCRTDVYTDDNGKVNVAYRGLIEGQMGRPIRDMMIATSQDNGSAFGSPTRISVDNWSIDGCPHTGPALCSSKGNLQALWYTEGGGAGIYFASKQHGESTFRPKQAVTNVGHHPQASAKGNRMAFVWEENVNKNEGVITQIHCQLSNDDGSVMKTIISSGLPNAYLPVVTETKNGFVAAFIVETDRQTAVYYKKI